MHQTTEIKITPAQREKLKRAELKERRLQASIDFEIMDEVLLMKSPDAMKKVLELNRAAGPAAESYARPILEAADRWGRLMQVRMKNNRLTRELVDMTQPLFGDWGVRAPLFLMEHWKYGDQLRKCLVERINEQQGLTTSSKIQKVKRQKTR